jgi:1,4-alpha-glucan branching enzyme
MTRIDPWWGTAVFYDVHLGSFQDANGDGIGDLRGVSRRLDYLQWLGVDAMLHPLDAEHTRDARHGHA